ncbi:MAG: hypothetical protein NTZ52_01155 [Chlamydiae bacterium]|nr:hypothetical protein [Chlamydiota bacterium]
MSYQVGISLVAINRDLKGHPLSIAEEAAYKELDRCTDFFLTHNRIDGSIANVIDGNKIRIRSVRGSAPSAINPPEDRLSSGSPLKNSFCHRI